MHTVSKVFRRQAIRICVAMMPVLAWLSGYSVALAELKLAGIFSDHMVLQRERSIPVWGWADKGRVVTVQFAGQSVSAKVNDDGTWQAILKPLATSDESRKLVAACDSETVVIADVVVGDIWHASGQSNMAMNVQAVAKHFSQAEADIAAAKLPTIRFRRIDEPQSVVPTKDIPVKAGWSVCSPNTVGGFSAAAFYFARKLQLELAVPIGIVDTSRGGTPIEPFIPRAAFKSHPHTATRVGIGGSRRSARHLETAGRRSSPRCELAAGTTVSFASGADQSVRGARRNLVSGGIELWRWRRSTRLPTQDAGADHRLANRIGGRRSSFLFCPASRQRRSGRLALSPRTAAFEPGSAAHGNGSDH